MNDDLDAQLRAWARSVDDPIAVDEVRRSSVPPQGPRTRRLALVVAGVLLVVVGVVAAAVTVPSSSDDVVSVGDQDDESDTSDRTSPTTEAAEPPTISPSWPPPAPVGCEGLESRTVWAEAGHAGEVAAPAGGSIDVIEVVTNQGSATCTKVFGRCDPTVLLESDGEPAPTGSSVCPAIGHPPEDLAPDGSREERWAVRLLTDPGRYTVAVEQHDGTRALLPVRLEAQIPACAPASLQLRQDGNEVGAQHGGTAFLQLTVDVTEQHCTVRVRGVRLVLRPSGRPDAPDAELVDSGARWVATGENTFVLVEPVFGPIDVEPGQHAGEVTIVLDSGNELSAPARVLVYR